MDNTQKIYVKDFDRWNEKKKDINTTNILSLFFRERQIWWCRIGVNVGYEQDGKGSWFERPVLVLRKFNQHAFIGVPLSTSLKNDKFHYKFNISEEGPENTASLSQVRFIDSKRLNMKMGTCKKEDFLAIRKAVREMFL